METRVHRHGLGHVDVCHQIDPAVATCATDVATNVNRVIEKDEIGDIEHALPFDGLAGKPARSHERNDGRTIPDLRMAIHAKLTRGHSGARRAIDGVVAIATIDTLV